jgi:hypothetical protein
MKTASIKNDLVAHVEKLPPELQLRVLDYAKALMPKGVKGKKILRFGGAISSSDLKLMTKAIENDCEKVDVNEW